MTRRDLEAAFKVTPGIEAEQFEVRYFAPRAHHMHGSNPGGFAGSMVVGDREEAERNAGTSTNSTGIRVPGGERCRRAERHARSGRGA